MENPVVNLDRAKKRKESKKAKLWTENELNKTYHNISITTQTHKEEKNFNSL
jgi:hypothetical protein